MRESKNGTKCFRCVIEETSPQKGGSGFFFSIFFIPCTTSSIEMQIAICVLKASINTVHYSLYSFIRMGALIEKGVVI